MNRGGELMKHLLPFLSLVFRCMQYVETVIRVIFPVIGILPGSVLSCNIAL